MSDTPTEEAPTTDDEDRPDGPVLVSGVSHTFDFSLHLVVLEQQFKDGFDPRDFAAQVTNQMGVALAYSVGPAGISISSSQFADVGFFMQLYQSEPQGDDQIRVHVPSINNNTKDAAADDGGADYRGGMYL